MFAKSKLSDTRVIHTVLSGTREEFGVLVNRYFSVVHAIAYAQLGNQTDADDVTQDTFLQAFLKLDSLRNTGKFAGWIATIARNQSKRLMRNRSRESEILENADMPESVATVDIDSEELKALLHKQIAGMKEDAREVLMLHYFAGKTTKEMADILDISRHAAKKRLERARESLGKELLSRLSPELMPEGSREKRTKAIMVAIMAAEVKWAASVTAAAGTYALAGLGAKSAACIAAAVALGFAGLFAVNIVVGTQSGKPPERPQIELALAATSEPVTETVITENVMDEKEQEDISVDTAESSIPEDNKGKIDSKSISEKAKQGVLEKLKSPVSIEFDGEHISDILSFLEQYVEVNIVKDYAVIQEPRSSLASAVVRHFYEVFPRVIGDRENDRKQDRKQARVLAVMQQTELSEEQLKNTLRDLELSEDQIEVFLGIRRPFEEVEDLYDYTTDGIVDYIRLTNLPLGSVLKEICQPLGLDFVVEPGYIWVSTPERIKNETAKVPDERFERYNIESLLENRVSIEFNDEHVKDILSFLESYVDVTIVLDYREVEPIRPRFQIPAKSMPPKNVVTDGVVSYIKLTNLELRDALKPLLRHLNLAYSVENGFIWVSTEERIKQNLFEDREPFSPILDEKTVSIELEDDHLFNIPNFLHEYIEVDFRIDSALRLPEDPDKKLPYGKSGRVPNIKLTDVTLRTALNALLRPMGLDYVVRDSEICISTPLRIRSGLVTAENLKPLDEID